MGLVTSTLFKGRPARAGDMVWFRGDYGTTAALVYSVSETGILCIEVFPAVDFDEILIYNPGTEIQFDGTAMSPDELGVYKWMWRD